MNEKPLEQLLNDLQTLSLKLENNMHISKEDIQKILHKIKEVKKLSF